MSAALAGIRVLELSRVFAGPAAAQVLGDLGADVIKVEEPAGDDCRNLGATRERLERLGGTSPSFQAFNRNKRSVILDLHRPTARAALLRMASQVDVLIHNFRPGTVEAWGIDYDAVAAINPRIVYAEFSAFGATGPMARNGANDVAVQAYGGLISATGEEGRPGVRCGTAVVDMQGSLALAGGILAALFHRERTGQGQRVRSSLLNSAAHLMSYAYADYWADGMVAAPLGTANTLSVPNQAFPTTDGSVIIIAAADDMWRRCAQALDAAQLCAPEFERGFERLRLRERLVPLIESVTRRFTSDALVRTLTDARVSVAKVNTVAEAADSEQLRAIGGVFPLGPGGSLPRAVATPFQLERTPCTLRTDPPALGEHTASVLHELGFTDAEIGALRADRVFG